MHPQALMQRFLLAGMISLLAALLSAPPARAQSTPAAPQTTQAQQAEKAKKRLQAQKDERRRWKAIMEWIKKESPDPLTIFQRVNEPVLAGCKHDLPQNERIAKQYQARAAEMAKNPKAKATAELYVRAAKLYADLAGENLKVLKAGETGYAAPIKEALAAIPKLEESIAEVTGRPPRRDWFLPAELSTVKKPQGVKPAAKTKPSATNGAGEK